MKNRAALIFICFWLIGQYCRAETIIDQGASARVIGQGRAFIAGSDDPALVFINPAGLTLLKRPSLTNTYNSILEDTQLIAFGAAFPGRFGGTMAVGYVNQTTTGVNGGDFFNQGTVVSYARKQADRFSFGAGIEYFSKGLTKNLSPGSTGAGMDLNAFLRHQHLPWLGFGLNFQNILPESLGGKFNFNNGKSEGIPANVKFGASFKLLGQENALRLNKQTLFLNLDAEKTANSPVLYHFGSEWWLNALFAVRGGIAQSWAITTSDVFNNLTLGFGLKYAGFMLDYAYFQNGDETKRVDHYFSIGYVGREEVALAPPAASVEARPKMTSAHFKDVADTYRAKEAIERLAALKIMDGYADGTFRPDSGVSKTELVVLLTKIRPGFSIALTAPNSQANRAEAIKIIDSALGLAPARVVEAPFADIGGRHWAAPYVTAAKEAGILKFLGNKFEPNKKITRAEIAQIIYQTKDVQGKLKQFDFVP